MPASRSQCVVTKIDLTESGQDMLDRLRGGGNALKLKLGFIPVRGADVHAALVSMGVAGQR